jgi:hypothetical protein
MNAGTLLIFAGLLFAAWKLFGSAKNSLQDLAADNLPGSDILGVRSVGAGRAANWVRSRPWLTKSYRDWAVNWFLTRSDASAYRLDRLGDIVAADIAKDIIRANTVIFGEGVLDRLINRGLAAVGSSHQDNPDAVVSALRRIKNQVQALEVAEWYYVELYAAIGEGKNLSKGLQWLPDAEMIQAYEHLKNLPTGVFKNGAELSKLPKP